MFVYFFKSYDSFPIRKNAQEKWKEEIFDKNGQNVEEAAFRKFIICENHFERIDLRRSGNGFTIRDEAFPKYFPKSQ